MANQQYLKLKIAALESERDKKHAEIEQIEDRIVGYTEQLEPEPATETEPDSADAGKTARKKS